MAKTETKVEQKKDTVTVIAKQTGSGEMFIFGHKFKADKKGAFVAEMPKAEAQEWVNAGQLTIKEDK